jgi:glycosyltransferase involved in cell wall biosynthesis
MNTSTIIRGLGGYTCIRDNMRLGYCVELAIESLLKVCEEVVVADCESTDGTLQMLQRWADREPRLKIVTFPWTNPSGVSHRFWVEWLNFARQHLTTKFQITLDGDEILDDSPACHAAIREAVNSQNPARRFRRNNYWKSPELVIPTGYCCADRVVRLGLAEMAMPSDQPVHPGEYPIVDAAVEDDRLLVHHVGFLRPATQFYRKADEVLRIWFSRGDQRLEFGERDGKQLWETEAGADYNDKLVKHTDTLPEEVQKLLCSWGHFTEKYVPILTPEADPVIEVTEERGHSMDPWNVLHVGDYGDIVHMLPICKALGKVNLFFRDNNVVCKRILERLHVIQPLLESQPYIGIAKAHEGEQIHWNAGDFRQYHSKEHSLAYSHWLHYKGQSHLPNLQIDLQQPWLGGIKPDPRTKGKIVIHRTSRYQNQFFRWQALMDRYADVAIFLGTAEEHKRFTEEFGRIDYCPTRDLLEMAQLIVGSEMFMGNQSVGLAIAEGLKHPRVAEICPWQPDVLVGGGQVHWSADGTLSLPAMCGKGPINIGSGLHQLNYLVQTNLVPKLGWHGLFPEYPSAATFKQLMKKVSASRKVSEEDAHKMVLDRLFEVQPGYFPQTSSTGILETVERAKKQIVTSLA